MWHYCHESTVHGIIVGKKTLQEPVIHLRQMLMVRSGDDSGLMPGLLLGELSQTEFWCLEILLVHQLAALKTEEKKESYMVFTDSHI